MHRYTFYLLIALLAFGVGTCFVYVENLRDADTVDEIVKSSPSEQKQITSQKSKNIDFKCENQYLQAVWNHLQEDNDYRQFLDKQRETADCSEVFAVSDAIDLNNDNQQEAFVSDNGLRSGVFSQSFWIVRKIENSYEIILEGKDLEYEIENRSTNGFRDLVLSFKDSLEEYEKALFQFDGKSYKPMKCWNEIVAARNRNDSLYVLKKPRITPIACDFFEMMKASE